MAAAAAVAADTRLQLISFYILDSQISNFLANYLNHFSLSFFFPSIHFSLSTSTHTHTFDCACVLLTSLSPSLYALSSIINASLPPPSPFFLRFWEQCTEQNFFFGVQINSLNCVATGWVIGRQAGKQAAILKFFSLEKDRRYIRWNNSQAFFSLNWAPSSITLHCNGSGTEWADSQWSITVQSSPSPIFSISILFGSFFLAPAQSFFFSARYY